MCYGLAPVPGAGSRQGAAQGAAFDNYVSINVDNSSNVKSKINNNNNNNNINNNNNNSIIIDNSSSPAGRRRRWPVCCAC